MRLQFMTAVLLTGVLVVGLAAANPQASGVPVSTAGGTQPHASAGTATLSTASAVPVQTVGWRRAAYGTYYGNRPYAYRAYRPYYYGGYYGAPYYYGGWNGNYAPNYGTRTTAGPTVTPRTTDRRGAAAGAGGITGDGPTGRKNGCRDWRQSSPGRTVRCWARPSSQA